MITRLQCLVLITVVLTASTAGAGQLPVRVDLTRATANPDFEYYLETANVLRNGSATPDMAVCLSRAQITPNGLIREPSGTLVAFIAANTKTIEAIASRDGTCQGPDCSKLEIRGADHNLQFDTAPYKRFCDDPAGIAKQFGYSELLLGELSSITKATVEITIRNVFDESMTVLGVTPFSLRQTCEVPDAETDIRCGRNWFADIWGPSPWMPGYSLYVCSEGVRVCSFSYDFMHDSTTGACDGGSPLIDTHCALDPWEWPDPYPAGDCCCAGCGPPVSCVHSDLTPGVAEVPPDPW